MSKGNLSLDRMTQRAERKILLRQRELKRLGIADLRAAGWTLAKIGEWYGMSRQAVHQVLLRMKGR